MIPRSVTGTLALAFVLAGCLTTRQLHDKVEIGIGTLGQLPPDKVLLVRVTPEAAATTVLQHERETGWPDLEIDWEDGHCVLVAWLERHPMSRAPDPAPSAVYVVRLVDSGGSRVTWVMVDATTGELDAAIGDRLKAGCDAPAPHEAGTSRDIAERRLSESGPRLRGDVHVLRPSSDDRKRSRRARRVAATADSA